MNRHDSRDVRSYRLVNGRIVQSVGTPETSEPEEQHALYPTLRHCPECGKIGCDVRCPAYSFRDCIDIDGEEQ